MPGIRVPDAQYEAPTPTPEQAQVPMPKQPVANANMFGAAQAEAGVQAGEKVQGAAIDIADRMLQVKQWNQQSQMYDDKESYKEFLDKAANDQTPEQVTDPDGTIRTRTTGYLGWTDKQDLAQIPQRVIDLQAQGTKQFGPQAGETLVSVGKMYSRYWSGINTQTSSQATKYVVDQTKQNTMVNYNNAFAKGMTDTSPENSFSYYENLHDIGTKQIIGTSVAMGTSLSPKELQKAQKNMFPEAMSKYFNDKIFEGKMTVVQANQDLDNTLSKLKEGENYESDDVDKIRANIDDNDKRNQARIQTKQEIQTKQATIDGLGRFKDGFYSGKSLGSIWSSGMDEKLIPSLYEAQKYVEGKQTQKGSWGSPDTKSIIPIKDVSSLGLDTDELDKSGDSRTADAVIDMVKSTNYQDARDILIKAITDRTPQGEMKLTGEKLDIYTRALALVSQHLPTNSETQQGKTIDPKGVPQIGGLKDVADFGQKANLPDLSHLREYLDNNDNKMDSKENSDAVKKTAMNKMFPQTIGTGTVPSMVVGRDYSKRLFMGREADSSGYPFIYDEATKRAIPNKDYNKAQ